MKRVFQKKIYYLTKRLHSGSPPDLDIKKGVNVNLRATMTCFYLGNEPRDIGNTLSFLGVPGDHTWHNYFYNNKEEVNNKIMEECQAVIDEGLGEEIRATIKSKLGLEYSPNEINEYISNFYSNSGFIPDKIRSVGIIVSYDMGWKKEYWAYL